MHVNGDLAKQLQGQRQLNRQRFAKHRIFQHREGLLTCTAIESRKVECYNPATRFDRRSGSTRRQVRSSGTGSVQWDTCLGTLTTDRSHIAQEGTEILLVNLNCRRRTHCPTFALHIRIRTRVSFITVQNRPRPSSACRAVNSLVYVRARRRRQP